MTVHHSNYVCITALCNASNGKNTIDCDHRSTALLHFSCRTITVIFRLQPMACTVGLLKPKVLPGQITLHMPRYFIIAFLSFSCLPSFISLFFPFITNLEKSLTAFGYGHIVQSIQHICITASSDTMMAWNSDSIILFSVLEKYCLKEKAQKEIWNIQ